MRNIVLSAAFAAASAIALPAAAHAHAHLEAAQPPINGTVKDAPMELDLKFSEELNLKFTGVKVTGPDKKEIKTDGDMLMDGNKTFMVDLPAGHAVRVPPLVGADHQELAVRAVDQGADGHDGQGHGRHHTSDKLGRL